MNEFYERMQLRFVQQSDSQWHTISRFSNTLIILNVSMFFLTQLVITQGYYYTFFSIALLTTIQLLILQPFIALKHLWLYLVALGCLCGALYFLVFSIWYWITHAGM